MTSTVPGWSDCLQDDTVMAPFFHGAQIDVGIRLIRDLKTQNLGVKDPRRRQIGHVLTDMAEPDGVEVGV